MGGMEEEEGQEQLREKEVPIPRGTGWCLNEMRRLALSWFIAPTTPFRPASAFWNRPLVIQWEQCPGYLHPTVAIGFKGSAVSASFLRS